METLDEINSAIEQSVRTTLVCKPTYDIVNPTIEDFENAVKEIKDFKPIQLGLDTKTEIGQDRVSIITIFVPSVNKAYIFEIAKLWHAVREIPKNFIALLQSNGIIKVTSDPYSRGFKDSYDIKLSGIIDIRPYATIKGFLNTGVDNMACIMYENYKESEHYKKRRDFIKKKWSVSLTEEMKEYTVSRAALCINIFNYLQRLPNTYVHE